MEKDRGFKIVAIVALLIAVVGLSIAYAGYTATLKIEGTATVSNGWSIIWTDLDAGKATGYASVEGSTFAIDAKTKQTVSGFLGKLIAPGDTISYTWMATNDGEINAKVSGVTRGQFSCTSEIQVEADAVCNDLELSITYNSVEVATDVPAVGTTLNKHTSVPVKLTLTWKSTSTAEVTKDVTVTLAPTSFTYEQADNN